MDPASERQAPAETSWSARMGRAMDVSACFSGRPTAVNPDTLTADEEAAKILLAGEAPEKEVELAVPQLKLVKMLWAAREVAVVSSFMSSGVACGLFGMFIFCAWVYVQIMSLKDSTVAWSINWPRPYSVARMTGVNRMIYVQAEPLANYDYAPDRSCCDSSTDTNPTTGILYKDDPMCRCDLMFNYPVARLNTGPYQKLTYVEYTDATFTVVKPKEPWQGSVLILRAEVGDTMTIQFRNRAGDGNPYTMHPHGLRYQPAFSGAMMANSTGACSMVADGKECTYFWEVTEAAGPSSGFNKPANSLFVSSRAWWLHSHVNEPLDIQKGLRGAIIVTAKGWARPDGTPKDTEKEFLLQFLIVSELPGKAEAGMMHSINGKIYAQLPGLEMQVGDRVRWHFMGMGSETDIHTAHWHGETMMIRGEQTDMVELLAGTMTSGNMLADNPGRWPIHCHVADHFYAGMYVRFTIRNPDGTYPEANAPGEVGLAKPSFVGDLT